MSYRMVICVHGLETRCWVCEFEELDPRYLLDYTQRCSTPCREECPYICHERHYVEWFRDHNPEACERRQQDRVELKRNGF